MKYLLDTNICIYIIKKKPLKVFQRLQKDSPQNIGISSVTFAELKYGIEKSQHKEKNTEALTGFLAPIQMLSFEEKAASIFGKIRAELERKGNIIGPFDLMIAAHALALDVILVTNNMKEFRRVKGLRLENWTK